MKKIMTLIFLFCFLIVSSHVYALDITLMDSKENLAQSLVGSGITISNVSYGGGPAASGYFEDGLASGLGFDSGIILTSGAAMNFDGMVNTSDSITGYNTGGDDADLAALIPGYSINDAAFLEFDFTSDSDAAYFNYIFGSDEYNEWVNSSYNDVFGFFLDGDNVALIPGTDTAVSIDTVNNSVNPSYYNDNDSNGAFPNELDGFTVSLTAVMEDLNVGQTYHIKLAIADAGDEAYDSAVFLQAGSFTDTDPNEPVPEPATLFLLGAGLLGLASRKKAFKK